MVTKRKKNSNYKSVFFNRQIVQRIRKSNAKHCPPPTPRVELCVIFGVSACVCLQGNQGRSYGGVWVSEMETQLTHVNE